MSALVSLPQVCSSVAAVEEQLKVKGDLASPCLVGFLGLEALPPTAPQKKQMTWTIPAGYLLLMRATLGWGYLLTTP